MFVRKRDGRKESVMFDKITSRIQKLCYRLNMDFIDPASITVNVINGIYPGVTTVELDNLAAETTVSMSTKHPDYAILAARIAISNLHKETKKNFSDVITDLYGVKDEDTRNPMISEKTYEIVTKNREQLNSAIIYDRDFSYSYFGFKTLEKFYLMKINGKVVERPQHMLMRVAVGIHGNDIGSAIETYNLMSEKWFIHSPSTLLTAGTTEPCFSSSYLLKMKDDSIVGIYESLKQCALLSRSSDNIGFNIHCIRATGSYISSTNGISNGLVPLLRVYNECPGSLCIYLEPWHLDIFEYLDLKKATGKEEARAHNLSYALWIPDLFMKRVENDEMWSLMSPEESVMLEDLWGNEFEEQYQKYESQGLFRKQVKAQSLWFAIIESQMQTGMPYILYKDACNRKTNQQNIGTLKGSNLSTELVEFTAPDEIAVGNQATIALDKFVNNQVFDFKKLKEVAKVVTKNLNLIIDANSYSLPEAEQSNKRHRPIGIGAQGLADAFILMRYPYESEEAQRLNKQIFETIYYGALESSCELAEAVGPYETYAGSPASKGILQYDMWNAEPSDLWDWGLLKEKIAKHGLRNSLLVALKPTAIESQIFGNNTCVDAYSSNIFTYREMSQEFQVVNHHLLKDLTEKGLWDVNMKNKLIANKGSVQNIEGISDDLKALYKTVWEIPQRMVLKMAADRGSFVDQSQALNVYMSEPSCGKLTSMHFYGWRMGLKTGMYGLKTTTTSTTINLTTETTPVKKDVKKASEAERIRNMNMMVCSLKNKEECLMCSA